MVLSRRYLTLLCSFWLPKTYWTISLFDAPLTMSSKEEVFDDVYPMSKVSRVKLKPEQRDWYTPLKDYNPPYFFHPSVEGKHWADSENVKEYRDAFNRLDGDLDRRRARRIKYDLDVDTGRPENPMGRTGICGRGLLGRWGPNHASYLVVTRWFREANGEQVTMPSSGRPLLEFIAVKLNGEIQIPGGFVCENESYMTRCQKEFIKTALNGANMTAAEHKSQASHLEDMFDENSHFIYQGYLKDNRNTDNAWIEGCVSNIHDKTGDDFIAYTLSPGGGAQAAKWLIVHRDMNIHPSHKEIIKKIVDLHDAHW